MILNSLPNWTIYLLADEIKKNATTSIFNQYIEQMRFSKSKFQIYSIAPPYAL